MQATERDIYSLHCPIIRLEAVCPIADTENAGKSNVKETIHIFNGDLRWFDAPPNAEKRAVELVLEQSGAIQAMEIPSDRED